jgi:hypothetical protein
MSHTALLDTLDAPLEDMHGKNRLRSTGIHYPRMHRTSLPPSPRFDPIHLTADTRMPARVTLNASRAERAALASDLRSWAPEAQEAADLDDTMSEVGSDDAPSGRPSFHVSA